jgi:transcriptional regulator with XRE-family HTH domain
MSSLSILLTRLGQVIRKLRAGAGYSQERFAFAIKRHRTFMGLLERGKANPTVKTLHLVAEGLGVSVPELFALAAAEGSGTLTVPGEDRVRLGKHPVSLIRKPTPAGTPSKGSTQVLKKPRQKRRKPGK